MATNMDRSGTVLVVGGGVAGARVAYEAAGAGLTVHLIESSPTLGGTVGQLGHMFPLHNCLLCRGTSDHGYGCTRPSISPEFLDFVRPDNLHVHTQARLVALSGDAESGFSATVVLEPRYVVPELCINCNRCVEACPARQEPGDGHVPLGAYKPDWRAIPNAYAIARGDCCTDCDKCAQVCPTRAIDLGQTARTVALQAGAVVVATGFRVHDPSAAVELGYGRVPNVITGLEFERMASPAGPTQGRIVRPSDGAAPKRIAWLQCVGSRDKTRDYCSAFCCMYATKQAVLARQAMPEAECTVFFMDDRVFGKQFQETYDSLRRGNDIRLTRCRLFDLQASKDTGRVRFRHLVEDDGMQEGEFDLVVLSVGAEPVAETAGLASMLGLELNASGFLRIDDLRPGATARPGVFVAGAAAAPKDICDSTAEAAAVAAQVVGMLGREPRGEATGPVSPPAASVVAATSDASPAVEPRTGVFLCRCGEEIAGVIDVDALAACARDLPGVAHAQAVDFACLSQGRIEIEQAIRTHGLDRIVAGACTPRTHQPLFEGILKRAGLDPHALEFVGLREYCAWPHRDQSEAAARKARAMVVRGAARAATLSSAPAEQFAARASALVVGGGLSGMTAALHLAERGLGVDLVEKTAALGGNFARIRYLPGGVDPRPTLARLMDQVARHPLITVRASTEAVRTGGRPGDFRTLLRQGAVEETVEHGALVLASGGQEYRGPAYGLGKHPAVVTQLDLEAEIAANPDRVAEWREVVMISCVGPWSEGSGDAWRCSRNCCLQIMKNALRIKELNPACRVAVLMRETMTIAFTESLYTEARRQGVLFVRYAGETSDGRVCDTENRPRVEWEIARFRGQAGQVDGDSTPAGAGDLTVRIRDLSLGHPLEFHPDRLALAVALMPGTDNALLARAFDVDLLPTGFFAETEPKQRPSEVHRPGVYVCGLAHGPKPSGLNVAQALSAAESAARLLLPGALTARRQVAVVDESRCMGCLTCVRTCPYGVPRIDAGRQGKGGIMGASYIDPLSCQGCGTCPSECPGKAIELNDYRDEQVTVALGSWE